jgi:hypothetical protein
MRPLSPTQRASSTAFAANANWTALHALDLSRFALFVRQTNRTGRSAHVDFRELVSESVNNREVIDDVAPRLEELYDFGRRVLNPWR